ncbi:PA14 domain-containing protein, partial [Telluribacter sp.]|uniref:PA14 domain-containing protein n=1 Tax=Telluribacter sp. TaxID=1978767 RepID=UPI002E15B1F3|nr:PA14 domain-containing protein [Telluribacter sp.]
MIVNDNEDRDFRPVIETAYNLGFNAVYLTVRWDAIKCRNAECATNPNWQPSSHWLQIDQEVEKAKSLGMKIAFRFHLGSADLTPYGVVANRSEYLWGGSSHAKNRDGTIHLGGWQFRQFSFAKQSTIDRAKGFISEAMSRYKGLVDENNLIFTSVTTASSQELEYDHENLLDYSDEMVNQYRAWHKSKYCADPMVAPADLTSEQGKRWYAFRHKKLKEFIDQMYGHIRSIDSRIKIINEFGSAFDGLARKRGTLAFKSLSEKADGTKVNDVFDYDHRFSMDLLRTNLPGKWIMNETLPIDGKLHLIPEFINSSYAHGAKIFCVVTGDPNMLNSLGSTFIQVRDQWIRGTNGIMSTINTAGGMSYTFSEALTANFYEGNKFITAAGRNVYQEWLNQYNNNPAGAKAVNIYLHEDDLFDNSTCVECTTPPAPVLTASAASITSGQSSTLTASGCSGTVTWSTGQSGNSISVSPGQSSTYTATCTVSNCTSPNGSVTVSVSSAASSCPPAEGFATHKRWTGIGGTRISDLAAQTNNYTKTPNSTGQLTELRTQSNWGDNYGQLIQGYITAPQTGSYVFWISSDDNSELWLSSSESPGSMQRVAWVNDWTNALEWGKEGNQKSVAVTLTACQKYFFEIRHKDGDYWDNLAVGWSRPGQSTTSPAEIVPGAVLSPYTSPSPIDCVAPPAPVLTASAASITSGQSSTLTASGCSGTVTWSTGQSGSSISVSPGQSSTYTATCTVSNCTSPNGSVTVSVSGTTAISQPTVNCSTLEGFLDYADCNNLGGWAYDRSNPNAAVLVDIYEGSTLIKGGFAAGIF